MSDAPKSGANMLWGAFPTAWVRHAERLRGSAEVLWQPIDKALLATLPLTASDVALWDHIYAFLLVAGAALEAILKAAAMQAKLNAAWHLRAIITPTWRLQRWLLTHHLDRYAAVAGIDLSDVERAQLARFQRYVVWRGSYPVPIDLTDPRPDHLLSLDFHASNLDKVWFDRFYRRSEEAYQQHVREFEKLKTAKTPIDGKDGTSPTR